MYTTKNYPSKKAMKEDFKAGIKIKVFQPGGMFPGITTGRTCVEGPHFPQPHKWYAEVIIQDSVIVKVIS